jgi:hypothetical protein
MHKSMPTEPTSTTEATQGVAYILDAKHENTDLQEGAGTNSPRSK